MSQNVALQCKSVLRIVCASGASHGLAKLTGCLVLQGVSDPEKKRKAIGAAFIDVFNNFAKGLEEKGGIKPSFLVQGTLYPDVIESCPPPGSKQKHSHTIKSHLIVGGLPKDLQFKLVEPLRELFKVGNT